MNKLKDKTVNEIKNQRVQSIIENKNNYF